MDFEPKYILVIPPLFPLYFIFSPLPFLSIYVAGLNFLPIPELLVLLFPILVKNFFYMGRKCIILYYACIFLYQKSAKIIPKEVV